MEEKRKEYEICAGSCSGIPILVLPEGGVFLRHNGTFKAGHVNKAKGAYRGNRLYTGTLTDEEEALAMKYILLGGANNG